MWNRWAEERSNETDRATGAYWEAQFMSLAEECCGVEAVGHQLGCSSAALFGELIAPDVSIRLSPPEYHEIKHKDPHRGTYGLEEYRLRDLLRLSELLDGEIFYTIHDHTELGRDSLRNRLRDWRTVSVRDLAPEAANWVSYREVPSWRSGAMTRVPAYFWPVDLWRPLSRHWEGIE